MTKTTYQSAEKKKAVREFLFSKIKAKYLVGLAGPDINDYLSWCNKKGYKVDEIWENNPTVMLSQLANLKHDLEFKYKFGDIASADPNKENTVYDLDYCGAISTLYENVIKFKKKAVITLCIRSIGEEETLKRFFKERGETIISSTEKKRPFAYKDVKTNQGTYLAVPYFDTCHMITIAKIS